MHVSEEGPVRASWNPEARLLRLEFLRGRPEGDRDRLGAVVRAWVGWDEAYNVVASCESADAAPLAWRVFWAQFFRHHKEPPRVACYGLSPSERFFLGVLKPLMRMDAESFPDEASARGWLEEDP